MKSCPLSQKPPATTRAGAHRAFIGSLLPDSVTGGEREFLLSRFYEPNAMLYLAGLPSLTDAQKRVCCTVAFERSE